MRSHGAVASKALDDDGLVEAVLDDWRTAPVDDRVRAMLGFLETLTLDPDAVGPADMEPLREAGISDAAIEDAIHVSTLFAIYTRLADTFEFDIPESEGFAQGAVNLLKRGYA
jgi:uncharacterized peroxidase-related enzyme